MLACGRTGRGIKSFFPAEFLVNVVNRISIVFLLVVLTTAVHADQPEFLRQVKKILFLGDSITHAGHYISLVEAQLQLASDDPSPVMINLGLPSETCSGLSEPDHPFPRPNVHERIDRALKKIKPDVVVACYGMNDGIYYPFSEERFAAYQAGINAIIDKVHAADAKLVLMTPPAFDALPLKNKNSLLPAGADKYSWMKIYENYDDVLRRYAQWVMQQADRVAMVIDLHGPVTAYVADKRKTDPEFTMSPDGVHVNDEGHAVLADAILDAWRIENRIAPDTALMTLISRRQKLMHDAWLSEVGHKRPGVKAGKPIAEAQTEAIELGKQIRARVQRQRHASKPAVGKIYNVHFPASNKSGELSLFVDYYLWVPPNVQKLRGIIVHQHGCGVGASNAGLTAANDWHWQAVAQKWDCGLLGSSYDARAGASCRLWCDPRNGSADRFLQALDRFADTTGHAEINQVPWCLWGHSGGGFWASLMQVSHPHRIVAIWLQSGTAFGAWQRGEIEKPELPDAVFQVPVMACPGIKEKDHERFRNAWDGSHDMMRAYRQHGAPFGIAVDPRTGHECGDSRYLAIAFFDECLQQRLPDRDANTSQLKPYDRSQSRYLDLATGQLQTAEQDDDEPSQVCWLPSSEFAIKLDEFTKTGAVGDRTPPPPPVVTARRVNGQVVLTWIAQADFESGIKGFRIERNGQTVGQLPQKPQGRFGRPLFQTMSYSDTPEQPLPRTRWVDTETGNGNDSVYHVYSVNSVGLESQPGKVSVDGS